MTLSVKLGYSNEELDATILMSRQIGKEAVMMPKFAGKMQNISAPDFILGEGERWDHKRLEGESPDTSRNAISKKKKQATNFVIDVSNYGRDESEAIRQAEKVFDAYNTQFVESLVIKKGDEILKVYIKK